MYTNNILEVFAMKKSEFDSLLKISQENITDPE
jgi:hypothetical protein